MKFLTEYRGWIILLALVAVLVGLYFYLEKNKEDETIEDGTDTGKERQYLPMQ